MMRSPTALEVKGLFARYGSREVLRNIDLRVEAGEIFGLLGPNGAGKSTLVRAICGRLHSAAGTVAIAGRERGSSTSRSIGLVPQEIALYPNLTIRENLNAFGRLSGLTRKQTRLAVDDVSNAAQLSERLDERVDRLSGGWKRRVNIAAAILHRPALLILDEPTTGVDLDARTALHRLIQTLSRRGMGVLLITHDLHQAELLCGRVGFLLNGTLAPQGEPKALLDAAFAGQGELVIDVAEPPSAHQAWRLQQAGFLGSSGGLSWGLVGNRSLAQIMAELEQFGVKPREVHFRQPGLEALFLQLLERSTALALEAAA